MLGPLNGVNLKLERRIDSMSEFLDFSHFLGRPFSVVKQTVWTPDLLGQDSLRTEMHHTYMYYIYRCHRRTHIHTDTLNVYVHRATHAKLCDA